MSEALATPKLHCMSHNYVDFKKAFDSVDRSLMLCKLKVVGLPGKVIRAIWPIVRENFVQITTAECLSNSVTHHCYILYLHIYLYLYSDDDPDPTGCYGHCALVPSIYSAFLLLFWMFTFICIIVFICEDKNMTGLAHV